MQHLVLNIVVKSWPIINQVDNLSLYTYQRLQCEMSLFHGSSEFYTLQSTTPHVQNMLLNVKESTNIESDT